MSLQNGSSWIGVDLDGTLAHYDGWVSVEHIGEPVPAMVERIKEWLAKGYRVKIFTARVAHPTTGLAARLAIDEWCVKVFGRVFDVTHQKDMQMYQLWDDRCVCVERNTGRILGQNPD